MRLRAAVSAGVRGCSSLLGDIRSEGRARSAAEWALKVSGRPQSFCLMLKVIILTRNPEVGELYEMLLRKTVGLPGLKDGFLFRMTALPD